MKIKICGLNPARDVQLCIDLKVNYLGFIFYEKSPRNISLSDIKILSNYDKKRKLTLRKGQLLIFIFLEYKERHHL